MTRYELWNRREDPDIMRMIKIIKKHLNRLDKELKSLGFCIVFTQSHLRGFNVYLGKEEQTKNA